MSRRQQRARHARRKQANARMRALGVAGGVAVASLGAAVPAQAAFDHVYTVTTTADTGPGSLRDALTQANNDPVSSNDEVVFDSSVTGTIALQTPLPVIKPNLTMQGPGARSLAIDGSAITTSSHAILDGANTLIVSGLTIEHGIDGGIQDYGHPLTLSGVTVTGNGQPKTVHNRISAVYDAYSPLTIENSTVTGNTGYLGDAVYSYLGAVKISNSTIAANQEGTSGGVHEWGAQSVEIDDSTITGNTGGNNTGGVTVEHGGTLSLNDSVVAGNTSTGTGSTPDVFLSGGSSGTVNFSLLGQTAAEAALTLDAQSAALAGKDPKLGPLQNNGGPTDTELPQPGSPLLDAGKAFGLTTDQRGLVRPSDLAGTVNAGDGSDIGAVEVQAPSVTGVAPTSAAAGSTVTITGSGFTGATGVGFGSAAASSFHVLDDTHVTAVVPAGSGTVDVRVTTPYGSTAVVTADHFTYPVPVVIPPPPARPVITGLSAHTGSSGQTLRILGSHLAGASAVTFGSVKARFKITSDGSITATVPSGKGRVDVSVTGPGGRSATGAADRFSYLAATIGHHNASAKWKGSKVIVDSGLVVVCPTGGDRCSVSVKATAVVPAALARVRKVKTKTLTLGSGSFHVSAGKRGEVTFTLTRKGLRALKLFGKLKMTVAVTVVDGSAKTTQKRTITVRLPKQPKKRK